MRTASQAEAMSRAFAADEVRLPSDFTVTLPTEPWKWLSKYGVVGQDHHAHLIGWSELYKRLIFPVSDKNYKLVMWTGRYFGRDPIEPKYWTVGNRNDVIHILGEKEKDPLPRLVLVEDIVSAIKVSHVHPVMCLFGANLPLEHARKLSERFSELVIWLDPDMHQNSLKQALKLEPWFNSVQCIFSDKDPKAHTFPEIREKLGLV